MGEEMLVGPGVVVTAFGGDTEVIENGGVVCSGERISAVAPWPELVEGFPQAKRLDAGGGLIIPGLVNLHHHFYSTLARGLDPGASMHTFDEVLKGLWWRLDRALDADTVRLSVALSLADCIRWGCTTVFDHHASPSYLEGSLDLIAEQVATAGLSAALCYEVSDRNSHDEALRGLEENFRFARVRQGDPRIRGLLGLHASFTVADETLERAQKDRPDGLGIHVHLCEDPVDSATSRNLFGARPLERFERYGLLDNNAVLAHGVHLAPLEYERVGASGATLVHNPESNSNNGVGRLDVLAAAKEGASLALGTDGMSCNMLRSLRAAFLTLRAGTGDPTKGFEILPDLLATNTRVAADVLDEPRLGHLEAGAPADLVVVDNAPPTPIAESNLFAHYVYGVSEASVRHTVARGRVLFEDFRHKTLDVKGLSREAHSLSPGLWDRFGELSSGECP